MFTVINLIRKFLCANISWNLTRSKRVKLNIWNISARRAPRLHDKRRRSDSEMYIDLSIKTHGQQRNITWSSGLLALTVQTEWTKEASICIQSEKRTRSLQNNVQRNCKQNVLQKKRKTNEGAGLEIQRRQKDYLQSIISWVMILLQTFRQNLSSRFRGRKLFPLRKAERRKARSLAGHCGSTPFYKKVAFKMEVKQDWTELF
jgi:hypothetical protein